MLFWFGFYFGCLYLLGCSPRSTASYSASSNLQRYKYTQLHVGVQVRIILYAENEAAAEDAARQAFSTLATLEDIFSDYRPTSEVRQLTENAIKHPHRISQHLFAVLDHAGKLARATEGAFDVTAGPYTHLWRKARQHKILPHPDSLTAASYRVGWEHITLHQDNQTALLRRSGMVLDLGGIAKGYMLDEALRTLKETGHPRALLEAGGDIVVGAPPPGEAGWTIRVENASASFQKQARALSDAAIATSGASVQFVEIDNTRYSHVVDPRTGLALTHAQMATVIAPSGLKADSYATALTVLKPSEQGTFLAAHPDVKAHVRAGSSH